MNKIHKFTIFVRKPIMVKMRNGLNKATKLIKIHENDAQLVKVQFF